MPPTRHRATSLLSIMCLFCCLMFCPVITQTLRGQQNSPSPLPFPPVPNAPGDASGSPPSEVDEAREKVARDAAKKANLQRQAAIKNDTDKLLKLATELKADVDKSNENLLSMNVVKKAEEIEKLAHSVKDKMKGPN